MVEAFVASDFEVVHQYHERYYRFKHPAELLASGTLDEQVGALRGWVQGAFADAELVLRAAPRASEPEKRRAETSTSYDQRPSVLATDGGKFDARRREIFRSATSRACADDAPVPKGCLALTAQ